MAHFWVQDPTTGWAIAPLEGEVLALSVDGFSQAHVSPEGAASADGPRVARRQGPEGESWVLMAGTKGCVRVNGLPLVLGLQVLADRDEVLLDGSARLFFSTEQLARVESAPQTQNRIFCPRCKQAIDRGSPAVKCPQCGGWHHQSEELPCWTYSKNCALCDQSTELQAGYRWTPEEI